MDMMTFFLTSIPASGFMMGVTGLFSVSFIIQSG